MPKPTPELPQTDWFRADSYHPAHPGYYKVRGGAGLSARSRLRLVGVDLRYWNGSGWLTWERGLLSVFGQHASHEWCGQRRWVLMHNSAYLVSMRPGSSTWAVMPERARPFKSEAAALRYASRYPRIGLTAVLP